MCLWRGGKMNENYKFWKEIWDSKGKSESTNLLFLNGYEHLSQEISSAEIVNNIISILSIEPTDTVLEVGCGCGFLSREFNKYCSYVGTDYSQPIIDKHKELFEHNVYKCESNNLFFNDFEFDHVFCYGLFQYLPTMEYANKTLLEMERVCKQNIFLGDLKSEKTRKSHFVYPKETLIKRGYTIVDNFISFDDVERYNALRRKG